MRMLPLRRKDQSGGDSDDENEGGEFGCLMK